MFIDIDAAHSGNEARIPGLIDPWGHAVPVFLLLCDDFNPSSMRPNLPAAVHYIKSVICAGRDVQARFLNDFHGSGKQPNAQFWPYFDERTGEKRMGVKTIAQIQRGQARHATCHVDPRRD